MTDRERLIELFLQPMNVADFYDKEMIAKAYADRILADGWIRPPCKVGDELYCVYSPPRPANPADKGKWYMDKFEVARFHYGVKGLSIEMYGYGTVNANEIGKTVFIGDNAKEEAEKALAERTGNK